MDLPQHLVREMTEAERRIEEAQEQMNAVQHSIALWKCSQGRHVIGEYLDPPIGRACIYCRAPEETHAQNYQPKE